MRLTNKILVVAAALVALATTAAAQNVVGNWKGKIVMDMSKMPKAQNPQQQKMIDNIMATFKKMKISLNMKSNKTYMLTVSGAPAGMGSAQGGSQTNEGTWKQTGSTITITPVKDNGKPAKNKQTQTLTVDKGGKTMTLTLPSKGGPAGGKLVFTR